MIASSTPRASESRGNDEGARPGCGKRILIALLITWAAAAAITGLAERFAGELLPRSIWEQDEAIFAGSVLHHNLWINSPQAPGFPLWTALGRFADPFLPGDSARGMILLSVAACLIALLPIGRLGQSILSDRAGLAAALFWLAFPVTIFYVPRAFADAPALPFLFGALLLASGDPSIKKAAMAGALAGIATGFRPQLSVVIVPALLVSLAGTGRRWSRLALAGAAAFTATCLAWFVPLVADAGGLKSYFALLNGRAGYVQQSFTEAGRVSWIETFFVRDFGGIFKACAILSLAIAGIVWSWRRGRVWLVTTTALVSWTLLLTCFSNPALPRYSLGWGALIALFVLSAVWEICGGRRSFFAVATVTMMTFLAFPVLREIRASYRRFPPPVEAIRYLASNLDPSVDFLLGDTIFWSHLRLATWAQQIPFPAEEVNDLLPYRDPDPERRKTILEDRTDGDWSPLGPNARVWSCEGPALRPLSQQRLLRVVWDPDALVFALGTYPPEIPPHEPAFRWMTGRAYLYAPPSDTDRFFLLQIDVPDWYHPTPLRFEIATPGACLFEHRFPAGRHWIRVRVPSTLLSPIHSTRFDFETDFSLVPAQHGLGPDQRWLAYRILNAQWLSPGNLWLRDGNWFVADVGRTRVPERFALAGFHGPELAAGVKPFRWTDGSGRLDLPSDALQEPAELRISAVGHPPSGTDCRITIDGRVAGQLHFASDWFSEKTISLEGPFRPESGFHRIEILSASSEPTVNESRRLGIAIERISIR